MNLTKEAKHILNEASLRPLGTVIRVHGLTSVEFVVNNRKRLIRESICRDIAACESALEELIKQGLLVKSRYNDQIFQVTEKGYEYAESLTL